MLEKCTEGDFKVVDLITMESGTFKDSESSYV